MQPSAPAPAPSEPTVGIAIPFFARVDYLTETLDSLTAQTDTDWQAVVIDDCSAETGASAVVAKLADRRIRYVRNETNLGLARNFNRCLTEPGTDVVVVLHADDLLEPDYIALIRACHRDVPTAGCVAPMSSVIDGDGRPIDTLVDKVKRRRWPQPQRYELRGDAGLARLMHTYFIYTPAISYRPALLPTGLFNERWQQVMDVELYAQLLLGGGTILLDRTPAYRYRRHAGTTTLLNARSFTRLGEETALCQEIATKARTMGWRRTAFACRLRWSIRLNGAVDLAGSLRRGSSSRGSSGRRRALRQLLSLH